MTNSTRGAAARTLDLLRCIASGPGEFTLKELAERIGLPQSTVHRLLEGWVQRDLVQHGDARTYRIGPELFRVASMVQQHFEIPRLARPILVSLWQQWQESAVLCLFNPATRTATVADSIASPHPLRYELALNSVISLAWGSLGRAILAHLSPPEIEAVLLHDAPGPFSHAPLPPQRALLRELAQVRGQRYAQYHNEAMNIAGVSAAVLSANGGVIGSIGVILPGSRYSSKIEMRLPAQVVAAAKSLSQALMHPADPTTPAAHAIRRATPARRP